MINRNVKIFSLIIPLLLAGYYFFSQKKINIKNKISASKNISNPQKLDIENLKIDGRKVIGLPPGKEKEIISKIHVSNRPSDKWDESLKETLQAQGGESVKDIQLKSVDSFIWNQDGIALYVESVIVNLKNSKGEETMFRVLVDAQSGKILKNWDQPVYDPVNPRDNFKIKIDPSYHSESGH